MKVKNVTSGHQVMCDIIYGCPLRKDTTPRDISLLSLFCFTRGRVEQRTTKSLHDLLFQRPIVKAVAMMIKRERLSQGKKNERKKIKKRD